MNIEDIIVTLAMSRIATNNVWDQKLLYSFSDQIGRGSALTEKQSSLALKIIKRHSSALSAAISKDILSFLANPKYRLGIRQINQEKKISLISHDQYKQVFKVEFPYDEKLVADIKAARSMLDYSAWDQDKKAWIFSLTEDNISFLSKLTEKTTFMLDTEAAHYIEQAKIITKNLEKYVPMLVCDGTDLKFANISENCPKLTSKTPLSAIFEARTRGIFIYDDYINNFLSSDSVKSITRDFLLKDPGEVFTVDAKNHSFDDLIDIILHLTPCVFVIPGGSELEKLEQSHRFLNGIGVANDEISVMFRLPSKTDQNFNDYVKAKGLNRPLTEKTKIVFISGKLPKPVMKVKLHFNSVINLGHENVHYTMREFVNRQENLIYFGEQKKQKAFDLGDL